MSNLLGDLLERYHAANIALRNAMYDVTTSEQMHTYAVNRVARYTQEKESLKKLIDDKEKLMAIQVEAGDLEYVRSALDQAATAEMPDVSVLVTALDLVQGYLNEEESTDGTTEVSDSEAPEAADEADTVEPVAEDDIPF